MPKADPDAHRRRQARERRVRQAAVLWGGMTLGGVGVVSAFALWHLFRRGRRLRDRLGPPRGSTFSNDDEPT